jgi:hypothetical protein
LLWGVGGISRGAELIEFGVGDRLGTIDVHRGIPLMGRRGWCG